MRPLPCREELKHITEICRHAVLIDNLLNAPLRSPILHELIHTLLQATWHHEPDAPTYCNLRRSTAIARHIACDLLLPSAAPYSGPSAALFLTTCSTKNMVLLTPSAYQHATTSPRLTDTIATLLSLSSDITAFGNGRPHDANVYLRRLLYQDPIQQLDPYAVQALTICPEHHSPCPSHSPLQVHVNGPNFLISPNTSAAASSPVPPPLTTTIHLVHIGPSTISHFLPRDPMAQYNSLIGLARNHNIRDPAVVVSGHRFVPASAPINQAAQIFISEALATSPMTPDSFTSSPPDVASVSSITPDNPATVTINLVDPADNGFHFPCTFPHSSLHGMAKSIEKRALSLYPQSLTLLHGRQVFTPLNPPSSIRDGDWIHVSLPSAEVRRVVQIEYDFLPQSSDNPAEPTQATEATTFTTFYDVPNQAVIDRVQQRVQRKYPQLDFYLLYDRRLVSRCTFSNFPTNTIFRVRARLDRGNTSPTCPPRTFYIALPHRHGTEAPSLSR